MEPRSHSAVLVAGALLAAALIVSSIILGGALVKAKAADRYVTVKGLAEREVAADLVIWPLSFEDSDNDLKTLAGGIRAKREAIVKFLHDAGIAPGEISYSAPQMIDFASSRYYGDGARRPFRYQARVTVTVRSSNPDLVKKLMQQVEALVDQGVVLVESDYETRTQFLFTKLNDIKPAMIEEATKNARDAAEKFAKDSQSDVGSIRTASQGLFTIEDRDANSPDYKTIRVVTSVQYSLAGD